jgi:hypothetical protein
MVNGKIGTVKRMTKKKPLFFSQYPKGDSKMVRFVLRLRKIQRNSPLSSVTGGWAVL